MDYDLLRGVAAARPDWQLVLIGPTAKIETSALPRAVNIHYLGPKSYAVATVHREANVFQPRLGRIVQGLNQIRMRVLFPAHPRTRFQLRREKLKPGVRNGMEISNDSAPGQGSRVRVWYGSSSQAS